MSKASELAEFGSGISSGPNAVDGLAKFWLSMDTVNNNNEGSLNASSYTDEGTGVGTIAITNAFSSQHDRCILTGLYNSATDGTDAISGATRGMLDVCVGTASSSSIDPLATGSIQFQTVYGSSSTSNGAATDVSKVWLSAIGDLA